MSNYEKLCEVVGIDPCAKCVSQILCCEIDDKHPDFTAEKQIEMIKLIADRKKWLNIYSSKNNCKGVKGYYFGAGYLIDDENGFVNENKFFDETFENSIAGLVLQLIEAGELDKKQVKEVLEQ